MKKYFIALWILFPAGPSIAQWSVKEGDPRAQDSNQYYLYQVFSKAQWSASNFATPGDMKWFSDARYGMFIHFGLNAFVNKDMSWPIVYDHKAPDSGHGSYPDSAWKKIWPGLFRLAKFNAGEWVKIAKDAGFKYIVIVVKHHDGFHMWDTKYADFKITNTPFKRDYLKELVTACHKAGMRVGLYYSQRDWYHRDYAPVDTSTLQRIAAPPYYKAKPGKTVVPGSSHKDYIAYQFNVVRELLTNYGKIDIFWFDAAWWGGMFTADMWDAENLTRMIRKLQPGIIINNRTSLPGDFDTPEQRIGMFQLRPWESAMTLNGSWGYEPSPVRPVKDLIAQMLKAAAGNGNVLLSWGAHFDGAFDEKQKDSLLKIGRWLKQFGVAYYGTRGGPWAPFRNYGAVYKGKRIFLYLFDWPNGSVSLPALHNNRIVAARYVNIDEKTKWNTNGRHWIFHKPARPDATVTIIELKMTGTVQENAEMIKGSMFDDPVYGKKAVEKHIDENSWKGNRYRIDLPGHRMVTGLQTSSLSEKIEVFTSQDGIHWDPAGVVGNGTTELSINELKTGALVPGRRASFVLLQTKRPLRMKVTVYTVQ
ncbi:alpha-L-fucosidase [Niabella drilacis]|uniref:alpha-L-fucosidase n=1 Tax=Niabella drilacis (strain DSM 25811 / CCM 8410 / CCUG 62505 / LMG 26954 / E90) TaxID=1285928 RepID=A0A1G6RJ05_NIADE|nr:alpha-L-fucosidase [Niabella drilacis]SDD04622.1 alpha-L-fucosidase [Niabella drilacis]